MGDMGIGIQMLLLVEHGHTTERCLRPLAIQLDIVVVACQTVHQGDAIDQHIGVGCLLHMQGRETGG